MKLAMGIERQRTTSERHSARALDCHYGHQFWSASTRWSEERVADDLAYGL